MIFSSDLEVLMNIERFASTRNYWYNTNCGFSVLYYCERRHTLLDDTSEEDKYNNWCKASKLIAPAFNNYLKSNF